MPVVYTPLISLTILFCCCRTDNKFPYAIKDFRKPLQTQLTYMVSKGIVGLYDDSLRKMATNKELVQLSQSEHPVLRATAFREMLKRTSFDHLKVIMEHLDDTAIISFHAGEGSVWNCTVSDDIINLARWKTNDYKNKTIDAVITKHNYLRAAYTILLKWQPQEKHYPYIKDMAFREQQSIDYNGEPYHSNVQLALLGLAKFKKKEDVKLIKDRLLNELWRLGEVGFKLMREYPDEAYLEIFEKYYPYRFYQTICHYREAENAVNFINSLAVYKNDRSARILDSILNRKPFVYCTADSNNIRRELENAIWDNPCEAYARLRKQVAPGMKDRVYDLEIYNPDAVKRDSSTEQIEW